MRKLRTWDPIKLAALLLAFVATGAEAQTYTDLYNFGKSSGIFPSDSGIIAQGRDGNLYSTTTYGGTNGDGTIFEITRAGKLRVLYNFDGINGSYPNSGLTLGTDGNLYGTAGQSGSYDSGTVFKITPAGNFTTLHNFTSSEGFLPVAPPIQGTDGMFYGTTEVGGDQGSGTVYKITPSGKFTTIHQFDYSHGAYPYAPLVQGTDGNFYGTTNSGGPHGNGTVFRITSKGEITTLYYFDYTHGDSPRGGPLVQGTDGNFYGTTSFGGNVGNGTVFKITSRGKLTVLHSFSGLRDGSNPVGGLVLATDGNFYGTTASGGTMDCGVIYRISAQEYSVIHQFSSSSGCAPSVTLLQHSTGVMYGDTYAGGTDNLGVFYSLNAALAAYAALVPTASKVGRTIGILGQGLTGTTMVSFNGTSAQFAVVSNTFLKATVPNGATTGLVTITTPRGNLVSKQNFQVLP